jgi:hypothetical protein
VMATHPEIARASQALERAPEAETRGARIELGQQVAAAVTALRERDERALVERLTPAVTELVVDPPASERVALNAQLLVRRDRREALDAVVRELAAEHEGRLSIRYVGPLAPYSFTALSLDAGDPAWA